MNQPHRYQLEPYKTPKSRHRCPQCRHRNKTFKYYIDRETGNPLAHHVGRCDRESSCGYHYTPRQYFQEHPGSKPVIAYRPQPAPRPKPHSLIAPELVAQSRTHYHCNNFILFLSKLFEPHVCHELTELYRIGTATHWPGATVFWQIDGRENVRTGKIMLYNAATGKRVKEPYNHIAWVHALVGKSGKTEKSESRERNKADIDQRANFPTPGLSRLSDSSDFRLKQCLFGEHLLNVQPQHPIALVESEKTAIIASGFMPEYTWMATGSLDGLNVEKCRILKGRDVILFPDANGYPKWQDKMRLLQAKIPSAGFHLSRYLLQNATPQQLASGADIADFYIDDLYAQWQLHREWGLRFDEEEDLG